MWKKKHSLASLVAIAAIATLAACSGTGSSSAGGTGSGGDSDTSTISIGAPACAHCLAMALLPGQLDKKYKTSFQSFQTLQAVSTSISSGRLDVAQVDYTGLVSFLSKGLPIIAISGQVNGGSDMLARKGLGLTPGDWNSLKSLVAKDKAAGHKLKVGTEFGTVQDIETRLQLPKLGIDPAADVDMVNTPSQGMGAALSNGSVDLATVVQPFAASILASGDATHFQYPYDQAAGNLTNVVVVNKNWAKQHPAQVVAIAKGMSTLIPYLKTDAGQKDWVDAILKYTDVNRKAVTSAVGQLQPDVSIPFSKVQAIADSMYQRKLISAPLTKADLEASIDYSPLAKATGMSESKLGAPAN